MKVCVVGAGGVGGLLAAVLLRAVYYLVWHVLYGNFLMS